MSASKFIGSCVKVFIASQKAGLEKAMEEKHNLFPFAMEVAKAVRVAQATVVHFYDVEVEEIVAPHMKELEEIEAKAWEGFDFKAGKDIS